MVLPSLAILGVGRTRPTLSLLTSHDEDVPLVARLQPEVDGLGGEAAVRHRHDAHAPRAEHARDLSLCKDRTVVGDRMPVVAASSV